MGLLVGCMQPDKGENSFGTGTDNVSGDGDGSGANGSDGGGNGNGGNGSGGNGGGNGGGNAPGTCRDRWEPGKKYHPDGYGESSVHGMDTKLQVEQCQNCHGDTLEGCGGAVTCNNCHDGGHPDGWRTNCTYCHGGNDNDTGAPPTDLDRTTPVDAITFTAHTKHVTAGTHPAFDCNQCHTKPVDILSPGHIFDDTHGTSEVTHAGGLSKDAAFAGPGTGKCTNVYCHGSGLKNADYAVSDGPTTCDTCHGTKDLKTLTYDHDRHINSIRKFEDITCASCHPGTEKTDNQKITDGTKHVDGVIDVKIEGVTYDPAKKTCAGTCHTGYPHNGETWAEKGGLFGG